MNLKQNHLGISISANTVAAVGLDEHQNITYQDSLTSEVSFFQNDTVDIEALTTTLKAIVQKSTELTKKAAVCFPERLAYSREYTLPKLKLSEIDEALQWQIGTIFPLQAEDIYFDWKLLEQTETDTKIVVVAVSRTLLDGLQQACTTAGIQPLSFEPSASVLARAQKDQVDVHIILEVDNFGSSASLINHGVSSLTTTSIYTNDQTLDQITAQISTSLQNLLFHQKHQDSSKSDPAAPPAVYLTGEKAASRLAEILTSASKLPVSMLELPTPTPNLHLPYLAALSRLLPPESELSINLLPLSLQHQYQLETDIQESKKTTSIGSLIGSICLITALSFYGLSLFMQAKLAKDIAGMPQLETPPSQINMPLTLQKARLISEINPTKQASPSKHIIALSEVGLTGEQIRKLVFDATRKQLQLTVTNVSRENIYTVKSNLEKTALFTTISVPLSAFSTDSNPEATITMVMK